MFSDPIKFSQNKESRAVTSRRVIQQHMRHLSVMWGLFVHPGVLELFAVSQGVIGIRGVSSNRFLAMNKRGRLHATVSTHAHVQGFWVT